MKNKTPSQGYIQPPRWKRTKTTTTITFDNEWLKDFAGDLNEWRSWRGWTQREDCQNWQRSPIARENRRESITYGNCLSTVLVNLGRRELLKLMDEQKEKKHG